MVVSLASGIGELVQILAQLTNPKVCSYASRHQTPQTYTLEINESSAVALSRACVGWSRCWEAPYYFGSEARNRFARA